MKLFNRVVDEHTRYRLYLCLFILDVFLDMK